MILQRGHAVLSRLSGEQLNYFGIGSPAMRQRLFQHRGSRRRRVTFSGNQRAHEGFVDERVLNLLLRSRGARLFRGCTEYGRIARKQVFGDPRLRVRCDATVGDRPAVAGRPQRARVLPMAYGRAVEQQNPALIFFFGSELVVCLLRERGANT